MEYIYAHLMEGEDLLNVFVSLIANCDRYDDRYNATESKPTTALFISVFNSKNATFKYF